jgi:D-alanyl-lipoteichoic acid acyltransferase DltB (MBOAT superfamily)
MLFSSFEYLLVFLPLVVLGHHVLRRIGGSRAAQVWLLLASLAFYAYPRPQHLPLLIGSIVVNWAIANTMVGSSEAGRRKAWLWLGLAANIGFLASFKYVDFMLGQVNQLAGVQVPLPNWAPPLGVSFFTLTQVMYLVDCYQEASDPVSLVDHASTVSFFPYVSSGPIVRVSDISQQFSAERDHESSVALARRGLFLLVLGLAKKVVLADSFASIADTGFAAQHLSTVEAWVFALSYAFQIYFDFSGYSDMAVGTAWLLGFEIPQNFNAPYAAKSISEFWQRWHISLSNFITNYLYTPILRSFRKATVRTSALATLIAMTIAGLWHGPAWTYIAFGAMHGVALVVNQWWKRSKRKLPRGIGWLLTFGFVTASFVVFRSRDLASAGSMLLAMIPHGSDLIGTKVLQTAVPFSPTLVLRPALIGILIAFAFKSAWDYALAFKPTVRTAAATCSLLVLSLFFVNSSVAKRFVYFAF